MSRSGDPPPHTPKAKSSTSTIYEAFKNLTGSKSKKSAATTSPSGAADPVQATQSSDAVHSYNPRDAFKAAESGAKRTLNGGPENSSFVGGPPELQHVLQQLRVGNRIEHRVQAAKDMTRLLARYPVDDVFSIWANARDLIDQSEFEGAVVAGYHLLLACVKYKTLVARERTFFLDSITFDKRFDTLSYRIQVLNALTSNGRYLDHFETSITPLLVTLLDLSYRASLRKRAKSSKPTSQDDSDCIDQAFEFTLALLKYNASLLPPADLERLLEQVLRLCRMTGSINDIKNSIVIIDAVVTYSIMPQSQLRECLEILCSIFNNVESQALRASTTIHKLMASHLGPTSTNILLSLIRDHSESSNPHPARGAVLIFRDILLSPDAEVTIAPNVTDFLSAIGDSLRTSTALSSTSFLPQLFQVLLGILDRKDKSVVWSDSATWADFSLVSIKCWDRQQHLRNKVSSGGPESNSTSSDKATLDQINVFSQKMVHHLLQLCTNNECDERSSVMDLLMQLPALDQVDDQTANTILNCHIDNHLLQPPANRWFENCEQLRTAFFADQARSRAMRLQTLKALSDASSTAEALNITLASDLILVVASGLDCESDAYVAEALCDLCVDVGTWTEDEILFEKIVQRLLPLPTLPSMSKGALSRPASYIMPTDPSTSAAQSENTETAKTSVTSLVRMFLRVLRRSAWKCQKLFTTLLQVAECNSISAAVRIPAVKLLVRLRADVNYELFVIPDPGCETLAASLCRTKNTYGEALNHSNNLDSPVMRPARPEEPLPRRKNQSAPAAATHGRGSGLNRSLSRLSKALAPSPPAWMYGEFKGLPEDPPHVASHLLSSHVNSTAGDVDPSSPAQAATEILKLNVWLELVIGLVQQKDLDWEIYSYIVVHLGAQLTNHSLFVDAIPQVQFLRNVLCSQLSNKTFLEPPLSTNLKKGDVAVCLYDILTMLIGYRTHFAKSELEEMVKVFVAGIGSWERTSECCIHALSICCLETPVSMSKVLDTALQKMTQIITQAHVAAHVLEFLAGLARMPELFLHFRETDYKAVFGICFRYVQFARDQRRRSTHFGILRASNKSPGPNTRTNRDSGIQLDVPSKSKSLADELPQYVYALAYHVMTFFFMSLRLKDRAAHLDWIAQNLLYRNEDGKEVMEEQGEVTIDYMRRIAFSDRDETAYDPDFAKLSDGIIARKSWVWGTAVLTIETAGRSGISQLTKRRPSGTKFTIVQPRLVPQPRHQVPITYGSAAEAFYSMDYVGITPDDVVQEMYSQFPMLPTPLPDDEATQRSLSAIDRIPALDGHKVGVIYVGEGQKDEAAILANVMGSEDYTAFLNGIGTLTRLKGANFNTQGLDREFDTDGKFTYCWRNRVTELVFHIPTLMPTNLDHDPHCAAKKRHTGNDFVNIIFNNSGLVFDFNTFPSEFNFVNIIIVPEARTSFVDTRQRAAGLRRHNQQRSITDSSSYFSHNTAESSEPLSSTTTLNLGQSDSVYSDLFYKVTVQVKEGLPAISPAAETKIISGGCLPAFVRLLALNASVFAQVWANKDSGEHTSSWRSRLREIVRLRERHAGLTVPATSLALDREVAPSISSPMLTSQLMNLTASSSQPSAVVSPIVMSSPLQHLQSPIMSATSQATGATVTTTTTSTVQSGSRESTTTGIGGGAASLLRRMSQAAFLGDMNLSGSDVSTPNRSSVAGSNSDGRDRESSVGSRASKE